MTGGRLTQTTADRLRELALGVPEGELLGTEKELIARFGVSRPTFRQAVHIVEAERLVESVRGLNGGLFSRRPDLEGVIASAATYLRSRGSKLRDVMIAANAALREAVGAAADCRDGDLREQLDRLIAELGLREHGPQTVAAFHDDEMAATLLICRMSDNPALDLAVRLFFEVGMVALKTMFEGRSELMQDRRTERLMILRAVSAGDRDRAMALCRRNAEFSLRGFGAVLDQPMQAISQSRGPA
jgi:DNA-binding FadR family transcriptional regulator